VGPPRRASAKAAVVNLRLARVNKLFGINNFLRFRGLNYLEALKMASVEARITGQQRLRLQLGVGAYEEIGHHSRGDCFAALPTLSPDAAGGGDRGGGKRFEPDPHGSHRLVEEPVRGEMCSDLGPDDLAGNKCPLSIGTA
jgi:hypothetical protein